MKLTTRFAILAVFAALAVPTFAAKPKKKREQKPIEVDSAAVTAIKPYDKDGNFEIDLKEFDEVKAAFKANPTGNLKQFDKGGDGVLDETVDRAAMNIKLGEAKMAEQKANPPKKKKKAQ